jgi:asparagine synthase (glutamine-hydrolysing)
VKEILAGERMQRRSGEKKFSFLWNGAQIADTPDFSSFKSRTATLRQTAEDCFAAWGREYPNIVVSLSGGLDSSILANLMRRTSDTKLTGIHYLGLDYERYEVELARLAAKNAGIELIEAVQDPAKDEVRRILDTPRLARPKVQSLAILIDDLSVQAAEQVGADCFMIGQGGDNLFMQRGGAKHTLTDYVRLKGLGADFWRVAYEAAMLQRCSTWKMMGTAFHNVLLPEAWDAFAFLQAPAQ